MSGRPTSLFRFPSVFSTGPRVARIAAIISRVVVFPFEPVTPTTGIAKRRRWSRAIAPSATRVSATARRGSEDASEARASATTAAAAPRAAASARNACASNRSPRSATKSAPGPTVRVSVDTPASSGGGGPIQRPPVAAASSSGVKRGPVM